MRTVLVGQQVLLKTLFNSMKNWHSGRSHYQVIDKNFDAIRWMVVLDSFYKASGDGDNILDQIYKSKYVRIFIKMFLIHYTKMHINTTVALNTNLHN